jgi:6-phospho-3-hexuloisomerase
MSVSEYMKEISEEIGRASEAVSDRLAARFVERIRQSGRVFVAGAGRSGLIIRTFAMRLMHMGFASYVVGETITPAIEKGDLLVIGSGSGETESLLVTAKKAKKIGAHVVLITICPRSSIAAFADDIITVPATTAKVSQKTAVNSIQPKGSLFEQVLLVFCEAVVVVLLQKKRMDYSKLMRRHANLE